MKTDTGEIINADGKDAVVRIYRSSACGHCEMCGLSSDKKFVDVSVENTLDAKAGDTVEISFSETAALKVSAIVYLVPLFTALMMTVCGYFLHLADWLLIIIFLAGLGLGFFVVRYIDKTFAKNMQIVPKMVRIIKENGENE